MNPGRGSAWFALVIGLLAALTVPVAGIASRYLSGVTLLGSLYVAAPSAVGLGVLALLVSRRARRLQARSVFGRGSRVARLARWLAWTGIYIGCTAGVALAVYGVLRWAE